MSSAIPEGLPPLQIHVLSPDDNDDDVPLADVGVVTIDGQRHLFLSPQSFSSAVRQVSSAMPDLPMEQVERLVREHCTEFKDFDELLGPIELAPPVDVPPPPACPPQEPARPRGRVKKWAIAAALLPALAGSWALGHFTGSGPVETAASAPDASSSPDSTEASDGMRLATQPFTDPQFRDFSDAGEIDCKTISALEAECTDADGMVMSTNAALGPDSTIFTFSYGSERLGLRIFGDAHYAETWTRQDGSKELYPNLVRSGRYVLWGTDKQRLKEYLELLHSASKKAPVGPHVMGDATPLPPRLAALTLGTLGLNEHDVRTILSSPQDSTVDAPVLLAARAVLGVREDVPSGVDGGDDDIVALAAGIERRPVVTAADHNANTTAVVPVTDRSSGQTSTRNSGSEGTTTAPAPDPAPEPEPKSTEDAQKPVEEKPKEPEEPKPDPEPGTDKPSEPERPTEPPTDPVVPALPVLDGTPASPQQPDPADPQPRAEGDGPTTEPATPARGDTAPVENGESEVDDGGLLALPQAWIAPAA
ncbi:hypothetical protein [Streptomyces sioyaensis]|uniref:hypothetical protein n=1 Tax=Streptomyces sioyaensis TaxID=67364 RepID=UPI003EB936F3